MTTSNETVTPVTDPQTQSRLSKIKNSKLTKPIAITAVVLGVAVVLKNKLDASVDGKVEVTVETDKNDKS